MNVFIKLMMQDNGYAKVMSIQGSSRPDSAVVMFLDSEGNYVNLTGCEPVMFAGPNGASSTGAVLDAFSGTAQFPVSAEMYCITGQFPCSFSLPNTTCTDYNTKNLTLKVVLTSEGIGHYFVGHAAVENNVQVQIDEIKGQLMSRVTSQEVQTSIDGINIGAVQLLQDSASMPTLHGWSENSSTDAVKQDDGYYRISLNSNVTEILQNSTVQTITGSTYTESFYFKTDSTTLGFSFNFYEANNRKENIVQATIRDLGNGVFRAYASAIVEDTAVRAIDIKDFVYTDGTYIDIVKPKFEFGNKVTDYSASDVDNKAYVDSLIKGVNTTLSSYEASITENSKQIQLRVTKETYRTEMGGKVDKESIISEINQSAETVSISANKIDLRGYVTATDLTTGGRTEINGNNITTGTITSDDTCITIGVDEGYVDVRDMASGTVRYHLDQYGGIYFESNGAPTMEVWNRGIQFWEGNYENAIGYTGYFGGPSTRVLMVTEFEPAHCNGYYICCNGGSSSSSTADQTATVTVSSGGLNLRTSPNTNSDVIESLSNGETVTVISSSNGWSYVMTNAGISGYCSSQYLTLNSVEVNTGGNIEDTDWQSLMWFTAGGTHLGKNMQCNCNQIDLSDNYGAIIKGYHNSVAEMAAGASINFTVGGVTKEYIDGSGLHSTSDRRLKQNIMDSSTDALQTINKMKFKQYEFKDDSDYHYDIGLIAQELQEIAPSLVNENIQANTLSINDTQLLQYALKAIQQLSQKVDELGKEKTNGNS